MNGQIRNIELNQVEESIRLSEFAFQFELSEQDWQNRKENFQPEQSWGYYVDNQLAAKLNILKLQIWLNGKSTEMGGIAGVATWPEYRRHGMVRKLLVHALETMKDNGQALSMLHPFEFPFYRKFGWETFIEFKRYEIPKELLLNQFKAAGHVKRTVDWQQLDEIYQEYARQFNGTLIRDEAWWTHHIMNKKATAAILYNESGEARGYIYYKVKNREMNVEELVFLDESARQGLLKFISDHDSMINTVVMKAPANDQLAYILANPKIKQEVIPYFMARIVDLVSFLESYGAASGIEKRKLELAIKDEYAPWNNGVFAVTWSSSGKAKVKQVDEAVVRKANKELPLRLTCEIGILTTMLLGYQRPTILQAMGKVQASSDEAIELLEQLIPRKTTHLMDFF